MLGPRYMTKFSRTYNLKADLNLTKSNLPVRQVSCCFAYVKYAVGECAVQPAGERRSAIKYNETVLRADASICNV